MYAKTNIETMNSAAMVSDLFEVVDGFVKQHEAQCTGG
jgi:hypothetical protein